MAKYTIWRQFCIKKENILYVQSSIVTETQIDDTQAMNTSQKWLGFYNSIWRKQIVPLSCTFAGRQHLML